MKKVVLVLATALTLLSCKKEVVNTTCEKKTNTVFDTITNENCGLIVADYKELYSITILFKSGKYTSITLTPEEWEDANVGEEFCIEYY